MTARGTALSEVRRLAAFGDLELAVPKCVKGIGAVIVTPESPELIAGVRVQPFALFPDDRGYFLEVQRMGRGLAARSSDSNVPASVHHPSRKENVIAPSAM